MAMKRTVHYVAPEVEFFGVNVESGFESTNYQEGDNYYPGGWNDEENL